MLVSSKKPVAEVASKVAPKAVATKPQPQKPAPVTYSLPTKLTEPVSSIDALTLLLYGERKIGKSSFASMFPKAMFLAFEKGYKGLSIFVELMDDGTGRVGGASSWKKFVKFVDLLTKSEHEFETIVIDTIDVCYDSCQAFVCEENGVEHPSNLPYGKGWTLVADEFVKQVGRLVNKFGVIFISHATEKETKDRFDGVFNKIIPTMTQQAKKYVSAVVDVICYYGYYGDQRLLTIRGSESIESGNRLKENFFVKGGKEKYKVLIAKLQELKDENKLTPEIEKEIVEEVELLKVHSIPCGIGHEDTYYNFVRAFNNQQSFTGKPGREENATLSDRRAPMKSGKNR